MLGKWLWGGTFAGLTVIVALVAPGCGSDDTASTAGTSTDDAGSTTSTTGDAGGTSTADSGGSGSGTGLLDGGVTVTYGSCPTVDACGGTLTGDWKITSGCLSSSTFDAAKAACQGIQESNVTIQASGTMSFTATEVTRDTTIALKGSVYIPIGGTCAATASYNCTLLQIGITNPSLAPGGLAFDSATCTATDSPAKGCNCTVTKTIVSSTTQTYSTTDGVLSLKSPDQTYDYCVTGNSFVERETTSGQALQLNVTLGKQ